MCSRFSPFRPPPFQTRTPSKSMWKILTIKKIINFIIAIVRWGEPSAEQTIIIITFYSENIHKNGIKKYNDEIQLWTCFLPSEWSNEYIKTKIERFAVVVAVVVHRVWLGWPVYIHPVLMVLYSQVIHSLGKRKKKKMMILIAHSFNPIDF